MMKVGNINDKSRIHVLMLKVENMTDKRGKFKWYCLRCKFQKWEVEVVNRDGHAPLFSDVH